MLQLIMHLPRYFFVRGQLHLLQHRKKDNTLRVSREGGGGGGEALFDRFTGYDKDTFKDRETDGAVDAYRRGSNTRRG